MLVALSGAKISGIVIVGGLVVSYLALRFSTPGRLQRMTELGVEMDRRLLYADLTVEEARQMVAEWEAMSAADRADLPDDRGAEIETIREDLAAHRDRWGPEPESD
jgi:hypothetical protein